MGKPLPLVSYNVHANKFEVGQEALEVLRSVKSPLGVVAVCGRARQGKSYILNQLVSAGGGQGFTIGPTHRPCTKGLWMWSDPLRHENGAESYNTVNGIGVLGAALTAGSSPVFLHTRNYALTINTSLADSAIQHANLLPGRAAVMPLCIQPYGRHR
eukprot:1156940-Pelagomonas_calceolata.AAC.6